MREGDMVRFRLTECYNPLTLTAPMVGLLVKHDKMMRTCKVLFENELLTVRSENVEKAGKKDGLI